MLIALLAALLLPQALLASRLDGNIAGPYSAVLVPLHVALLSLLASTVTRYPANPCECDICEGVVWESHTLHNVPLAGSLFHRVVWGEEECK